MGTKSVPAMQAMIRTAMTAEITGWAAMGLFEPRELLDWTGGWVMVSLSSKGTAFPAVTDITRDCIHGALRAKDHQCLNGMKRKLLPSQQVIGSYSLPVTCPPVRDLATVFSLNEDCN